MPSGRRPRPASGSARRWRRSSLRLFVFGFGYAARALAVRLQGEGWSVAGTIRRPEERERLTAMGVSAVGVGDQQQLAAAVREAQAVLVTAPPDELGCPGLPRLVP